MSSNNPGSPKVFISYSHDSPEHRERVLQLSNCLRQERVDCNLDQYVEYSPPYSPPEGWPRWMEKQIRDAQFVLVICTETYKRRIEGEEKPGKGHGVRWEGHLTYQDLYNAGTLNTKFIPVLLESGDLQHIPTVLQSSTSYHTDTPEGYQNLYRHLTDQPGIQKPELGKLRKLPPYEPQMDSCKDTVTRRSDEEKKLLETVKRRVNEGLKDSLLNETPLLELVAQEPQEQVDSPRHKGAQQLGSSRSQPSSDIKISQVFSDFSKKYAGKLLILGAPGSGKTTTLLQLAKKLVTDAEKDASEPIPVLLDLTSWQGNKQSIYEWVIDELDSGEYQYKIPVEISKQWLKEQKKLVLLLDSLDEVKSKRQRPNDYACIRAINNFINNSSYGVDSIAICSDLDVYELNPLKLKLEGAVCLQPLKEAKIQEYLLSAGLAPELWLSIKDNKILLDLISLPLFIGIISSALLDKKISIRDLQSFNSKEDGQKYLFEVYIQQRLERQSNKEQIQHGLLWLAQRMNENKFFIENIQPTWLQTKNQMLRYRIGVCLLTGLIAALFGCLVSSLMLIQGGLKGVLVGALIGGLIGLLFGGLSEKIRPFESLDLSTIKRFWSKESEKQTNRPKVALRSVGLIESIVLMFKNNIENSIINNDRNYLINYLKSLLVSINWIGNIFNTLFNWLMLIGSWFVGLIYVVLRRIKTVLDDKKKKVPNQGIWNSAGNAGKFALMLWVIGLIVGMGFGWVAEVLDIKLDGGLTAELINKELSQQQIAGWFLGLLGGLIAGLIPGVSCIQHSVLRLILWWNDYIPWNYANFLGSATKLLLLQQIGGQYRFIHNLLYKHYKTKTLQAKHD